MVSAPIFVLEGSRLMHIILRSYGKVILSLAGALAAALILTLIVHTINAKTNNSVNGIEYESYAHDSINIENKE